MFQVATELRLLRAEIGKWGAAPPIPLPIFPSERITAKRDERDIGDLQVAIAAGHRNWEEAKNRAGI